MGLCILVTIFLLPHQPTPQTNFNEKREKTSIFHFKILSPFSYTSSVRLRVSLSFPPIALSDSLSANIISYNWHRPTKILPFRKTKFVHFTSTPSHPNVASTTIHHSILLILYFSPQCRYSFIMNKDKWTNEHDQSCFEF